MQLFKNNYYKLILILGLFVFTLSGCATQGAHFKIDPVLTRASVNFGGVQYIPLADVCNVYGIEYKWDNFIKTAAIEKKGRQIVLRAGSGVILVDGQKKELDKPVIFSDGKIFVPAAFVRNHMAPMVGSYAAAAPVIKPAPSRKFTIKTVVLDPGHGGKDAGAIGRRYRTKEKDMALKLALKIKTILESEGIKVVMTRASDVFIPLPKRAYIANRSNSDLFVSVHINASRSRSLNGFECYFLSNATDDNARALEAYENSSLKLGSGAAAERSKQLYKTLWDMTLTENRIESAELASHICDSVERSLAISNRGIRSARFYVLKHSNVPSVLVEAGYISNRYEESKIKDMKFLDRIAEAVAGGILSYKKEYEDTEGYTR